MEDEIKSTIDEDIHLVEHYRWLIDDKLSYLQSFRNRSLEIIGFNAALITFIWSQLTISSAAMETNNKMWLFIFISSYILLFVIQILFFINIAFPKKNNSALLLESSISKTKQNLEDYYQPLIKNVADRAKLTRKIYGIFIVQIILIILMVPLTLLNFN
ncbi:MAG: hypothetical protein OEZ01_09550 [Candidatus Heimdallarchaeota archaeon]|nr:hypothetical protein [Candidatus Heimdallarchaeota archaeon]MDH5646241.1 hypothetical protein [Candidatus Heimdallarchaeota archaeon]